MRNWIGSIHFPEDARINIQKVIDENSRTQLSSEQLSFLEKLAVELGDSEWSDKAIGNTIRMTSVNSGSVEERPILHCIGLCWDEVMDQRLQR